MNNSNFATSSLKKALLKFITKENTLGLNVHNSNLVELSVNITKATQLDNNVTLEFTQFFRDSDLEEVESEVYVCVLTADQIRTCL